MGWKCRKGGAKLDESTISDFEKWIQLGAPDPREHPPSAAELAQATSWVAIRDKRKNWWSFHPITRPTLPPVRDASWSDLPIDQFILHRLEEAGLQPAPEADRATLVRRLFFAIIGLPPTPEQLREFLDSTSPTAYQQLVDELLESPHFGERWARHWMDWIRYAESHGSEGDPQLFGAYHYRDYLIRALNNDVPYDQLVAEHVAGDLLAEPRIHPELGINESLIGTAHWRMVFHGFAPTDALDEKVRFTDDAINAFSKAFLGLTVSCARCHNHKFDPISQADYYALFGVIGSTRPGRSGMQLTAQLTAHDVELRELKVQIRGAISTDWLSVLQSRADQRAKPGADREAVPSLLKKALGIADEEVPADRFTTAWRSCVDSFHRYEEAQAAFAATKKTRAWNLASDTDYAQWYAYGTGLSEQPSEPGSFAIALDGERVLRGVYPAGVYSHLVSDKHGARLASEDFLVEGPQSLWLQIRGGGKAMSRYVVQDYPRNGTVYPVTEFKDDSAWRWQAYNLDYWSGDDVHVEITTANDAPLLVKNSDRSWFGVRSVVLTDSDAPVPPKESLEHLRALMTAASERPPHSLEELRKTFDEVVTVAIRAWQSGTADDDQALVLDQCLAEGWLPNSLPELPRTRPLVEAYRKLESKIAVATRVPTLAEWRGADQPLYDRGNHKLPREKIPRRFLEAIDPTPYNAKLSGRLQLARDLLRPDNPLTSRVIVNRVWHHLFGQGIVATPDNFGRLGVEPTHPALLDFLADDFRTVDQWSIKSLIRKVVTSRTWKQASTATKEARSQDPDNDLYSHFNVRRLEAEAVRDALLVASGQLDETLFGAAVSGNSDRRSVYVEVLRNRLDPFLTAFDAPIPFSANGNRDVTNVPAQSLLMMNSKRIRELAQQSAKAALSATDDDCDRINFLWRRALGREANENELQAALTLCNQMDAEYSQLQARATTLEQQIATTKAAIQAILAPVRAALAESRSRSTDDMADPQPVAHWHFDSLQDSVGPHALELQGSGRLESGALVLDGNGWAQTQPFNTALNAKTLEVFVQLDSLEQAGGGALTVQDLHGVVFDSIVFGERRPREWLAGSDNFRRTEDFGGQPEAEADNRPVHIIVAYENDGRIRCYRNGEAYGQPYQTEPQPFQAGEAQVLFGMRHGTSASGNRMLRGRILDAKLYDRALTAEEAKQAAQSCSNVITQQDLLLELSEAQRGKLAALEQRLLDQQNDLREVDGNVPPNEPWTDLAHSIFNLKEFIYVR